MEKFAFSKKGLGPPGRRPRSASALTAETSEFITGDKQHRLQQDPHLAASSCWIKILSAPVGENGGRSARRRQPIAHGSVNRCSKLDRGSAFQCSVLAQLADHLGKGTPRVQSQLCKLRSPFRTEIPYSRITVKTWHAKALLNMSNLCLTLI